MKLKRTIIIIFATIMVISAVIGLSACNKNKNESTLIKLADINYLEEIQNGGEGDLVFEWLKPYNNSRPVAIIIPGEFTDSSDKRFSMALDSKEYTFKSEAPTAFTIDDIASIGWKAQGLRRDLDWYWLNVANYNVAIFHWEKFADEESPDTVLSKLFSVPKMRYKVEDGYETASVPQYSLTEVLAAVYLNEMTDKANGKEIRLIGNGVGASLALSLSHYIAAYYEKGELDGKFVPNRLALCDPYFSTTNMNLEIKWDNSIDTTKGMMKVADSMLDTVSEVGTAVEMIESLEVTDDAAKYAYNLEKSEVMDGIYSSIKSKLAYFELREKYSVRFSNDYQKLKRVALDWYLYSIIGSDNTDYGYPSSYDNYLTYSNHTWGTNATRPMVNDVYRNAKNNSYSGKNYAISAWTPTTWIRALKGIGFSMKKYSSTTNNNTLHGNAVYSYKITQLEYFRSETNQLSDLGNYTLLCGYVYKDINGDKYINDGATQGIANAKLSVSITSTLNGEETKISEFDVTAAKDGFYAIKLMDKTVDDEGNYSSEGYRFNTNHTIKITFIPDSNKYYNIATGLTPSASVSYYETVAAHNFTKYVGTVTLSRYYANAITITNCLVAISE